MKGRKGFTLIELILVIAILGILAVSALPKFYDLSEKAKIAARDGVVGSVRAGIALYRANNIINNGSDSYPATLTGAAVGACSKTNPCFGNVLENPVEDAKWTVKTANDVFTYDAGGAAAVTVDCDYTPATGLFDCQAPAE